MKRDHSYHSASLESDSSGSCLWSAAAGAGGSASGDADVDELFAALGYQLRPSDMADVALKIEQLEQAQAAAAATGSSVPTAESTVHYNPSDLYSWLESMITGLNPAQEPFQPDPFNDFGSDLISIPGKAAVPDPDPPQKKLKTTAASEDPIQTRPVDQARPVVIVDCQENGIKLVHSLMACAEAVQRDDVALAEALVKNIGFLAVSQIGAMRKVATYFAEALARRIYKLYPNPQDFAFDDMLEMHFFESCPYLKFAHFTANQAILEAFNGKSKVHVIDFGIKQGMQWPALMQALALRPNGSPSFRLTGIGPPSHDNKDHLQEVGWKLARLAEEMNIEFEYGGFVTSSLADLHETMFDIREGETVCVNSIFELHPMLARPNGLDRVLRVVRALRPEIFTVVEQEANHNGSVFMDRFTESLHYYSTVFDSLESCGGNTDVSDQDRVMSEVYLGRQICNVVACEGSDRVERHETLDQWRSRFGMAGFEPAHLGSNAYKQASMLLALYAGGDGYRVEENSGCLMLGWHTRPLIATSAWRLGRVGSG